MLDSRRAGTGHVEVIPRSMLAVRRSIAGVRRLLLVAIIAFIAMPVALLVTNLGPALPIVPVAISIAGAAWFTIEIRRLERDLRRARVRALDAVDVERQRINRDLHDGAQQRLVALAMRLDVARQAGGGSSELLDEATAELRAAVAEVRDLARGLHPTILVEAGLGPAVEALAERATIPITVHAPTERFPAPVEAAAYFVVAEAIANTTKYAAASHVTVTVTTSVDGLRVAIRDDGKGGADPAGGSGLRGLTDRVAALGGRLRIDSPPGGGTTVQAELPIPA
jgi:signal transduction histidine kinase